jgi:hypothetical protein
MRRLEIQLHQEWSRNGFGAYVMQTDRDGNPTHLGKQLVMEPLKEMASSASAGPDEPTFRLTRDDAQALADALYRAGIRPTDAKDVGDVLKASQAHIADLRRVAFTLLDEAVTASPGDK